MTVHSRLTDPRRFREEIRKVQAKYAQKGRLHEPTRDGLSPAALFLKERDLANRLAEAIWRGRYQPAPAETRWATINDKQRLLYGLDLNDLIVHGVVGSVIQEQMQPHQSKQLYSYIKGRSWWLAIRDLAAYVRAHRRSRFDPRTRGLFVLRRDVRGYGDSIPLRESSPLWPLLQEILFADEPSDRRGTQVWSFIREVIRPLVRTTEGRISMNLRGIPTGSPISTAVLNLYLMPLDNELSTIPGGFYARFGDDFLFAHPDRDVAQEAAERIDEITSGLELETSAEKARNLFFNGAGRPSETWPETAPSDSVTFLGCRVGFDGTISLKKEKIRKLLRDLTERARRTREALADSRPQSAGPVVCAALNRALDPRWPLCHKTAPLLRRLTTDRSHLKQLDYQIARIVLRTLTGRLSVKAFRRIPYRKMREDWKLVSLYHERNLGAGRRRRRS